MVVASVNLQLVGSVIAAGNEPDAISAAPAFHPSCYNR
jgi:hypothetical protein